jgi:CRISPR-associated protein Cas1
MIIYLTEQGTILNKEGEQLILKKDGNKIATFLTKDLDQIVLMGNINLTTQTIHFLLNNKIDTVYTSLNGKYYGRLVSELGKNIIMRKMQFQALFDDIYKFNISKDIVSTKVFNCRQLLRKFNYYHKLKEVSLIFNKLTFMLEKIEKTANMSELLGIEGTSANTYFEAFDFLIKNPFFKFEKRSRRPPKNEVNAMLSFGYTLYANEVRTAVNIVGLDPYFGAYHAEEYGRPSLVLDVMEEFRPIVVDYVVINAINKNNINKDDFVKDVDEELPVKFTIFGRKKFISYIEKRLKNLFYLPEKAKKATLRDIIRYQAYQMGVAYMKKINYTGYKLI